MKRKGNEGSGVGICPRAFPLGLGDEGLVA